VRFLFRCSTTPVINKAKAYFAAAGNAIAEYIENLRVAAMVYYCRGVGSSVRLDGEGTYLGRSFSLPFISRRFKYLNCVVVIPTKVFERDFVRRRD